MSRVRDGMKPAIAATGALLTPGHGDEMLSERLTLIPIEAVSWVRGLRGRHCPEAEVEKVVALTVTMRRLALYSLFEQSGTSPVACVAGKYRASRRSECVWICQKDGKMLFSGLTNDEMAKIIPLCCSDSQHLQSCQR